MGVAPCHATSQEASREDVGRVQEGDEESETVPHLSRLHRERRLIGFAQHLHGDAPDFRFALDARLVFVPFPQRPGDIPHCDRVRVFAQVQAALHRPLSQFACGTWAAPVRALRTQHVHGSALPTHAALI